MSLGRIAVPAGGKTPADQTKQANLTANLNPVIPDLSLLSKGQLRSRLEDSYLENARMKKEVDRLLSQRIIDLDTIKNKSDKILEQQDKIIMLYSKLNTSEDSPLRIAG